MSKKVGLLCASKSDGFCKNVEGELDFSRSDVQRRNETDCGECRGGEQEHSLMQAQATDFSSKGVAKVLVEFHTEHQSLSTNIANNVGELFLEFQKTFTKLSATSIHVVQNLGKRR